MRMSAVEDPLICFNFFSPTTVMVGRTGDDGLKKRVSDTVTSQRTDGTEGLTCAVADIAHPKHAKNSPPRGEKPNKISAFRNMRAVKIR